MRSFSLPLAAVALLACGVTLVALSALQKGCDHVPDDQKMHIVDNESGDAMDVTDAVYGSASLQGVHGFSADILTCASVYRFQWFVASFELIAVVALLACGLGHEMHYRRMRLSFLGIFAMLAILYIQMTDSFLTASSVSYYREVPSAQSTLQAMITGCVATSALNILLVVSLGMRCHPGGAWKGGHCHEAKHAAKQAAMMQSEV